MSNALASAPLDAADYIKSHIRTVPDWPQAGVQFRDITPLLREPKSLRVLIDLFVQRYIEAKLDYIAGLDARGFIIGPILAYELNLGFIPIRKANCRISARRSLMSSSTARPPSRFTRTRASRATA
jgi:adenine phosphoribosyltransferase